MHRDGHLGAGQLAYAPVGATLVRDGHPHLAVGFLVVAFAAARLPDYDQWVPGLSHRGTTHSIGFALATGIATATATPPVVDVALEAGPDVTELVAGAPFVRRWAVRTAVLAACSHLLADAATTQGVAPLWPLTRRRVALGLVRADHPWANTFAFFAGVASTAAWLGSLVG